jgi:hypothetical protein
MGTKRLQTISCVVAFVLFIGAPLLHVVQRGNMSLSVQIISRQAFVSSRNLLRTPFLNGQHVPTC